MAVVHTYTRWSDEDQESGRTKERQGITAKDFIKKANHKPGRTYIDPGRSSFRGNKQKDLDRFLKDLKAGHIQPGDILFVEAIDRLSRKGIRPTQNLVNGILDAGIDIAIGLQSV